MDPCAERLDVICTELMLYYAAHRELPADLADVDKGSPATSTRPTTGPRGPCCPTSGKPYIYNPDGVEVSGWKGRMIVYDSIPCHWNMRWGILVEPFSPGKAPVFRIIHPPERSIHWPDGPPNP
ncbi:MAG: hypothetical protein ACE15C_18850 [Phycisphaerae bacterium]